MSDYWGGLRFGFRHLTPEELLDQWAEKVGQTTWTSIGGTDFDWLEMPRFEPSPRKSWRENYNAYFLSPAWKRRRAIAIYRAGRQCQRCGAQDVLLEVHHKTYARLCNELFEDLEALCQPCHVIADQERERNNHAQAPHD